MPKFTHTSNIYKMNATNKCIFYLDYFNSKIVLVWFLMRKDRAKIFLHELAYGVGKIIKKPIEKIFPFDITKMVTSNGTFKVRKGTNDITCTSPSFERRDTHYLKKIIKVKNLDNEKTAFLDIGADLGLYTILVGLSTKRISIFSFEPNTSTYALLSENIELNKISKKTIQQNYALGSKAGFAYLNENEINPGDSKIDKNSTKGTKIEVRPLTFYKNELEPYLDLVIKIDVEGYEKFVLEGAEEVLKTKNVYLLIEDFVDDSIFKVLEDLNFEFITKLTPYNSWWYRSAQ